jgi:hypothetical protein
MATAIDNLPIEVAQGDLETRYIELGDMAIRHAKVTAGTDMTPVLQGLPDDRCPSPHWGIVLEGSIHMHHTDGSKETVEAGQVYHWPAGYTADTEEGVVFIEVGPVGPCDSSESTLRRCSAETPAVMARMQVRGWGACS